MNKITRKTYFTTLKSLVEFAESQGVTFAEEGITFEGIQAFIDKELVSIDNRAKNAAARAADRKAAGDELREKIYNCLSKTSFKTINEIMLELNDPKVSAPMITSRLTQLTADPARVIKEVQTISAGEEGGKSRKLSAYKAL